MKNSLVLLAIVGCALLAARVAAEERTYAAAIGENGVQRIEMIGGGYFFFPNRIIVKKDVPVELVVRKEPGMVPHNIVMKSPEAGMDFDEALDEKPKSIRFTPLRTGTFTFFCSKKLLFLPSHQEKGMHGVVEVTE